MLKTNKFIVIVSENRQAYTRDQIFFIQYNNTFRSYENFSESLKLQLEKKSCNISLPFSSRTYECGTYTNRNDITNNIIAKHIGIKISDFENILFAEYILNGGIVIKPALNNNASYKSQYMYNNTTKQIVCTDCGNDDYKSIDRNFIDLMINASANRGTSNYLDSGNIIKNEPMINYLIQKRLY